MPSLLLNLTSLLSHSIITPTLNRQNLLPTFLDNYATGDIPSLKKIIFLWVNATEPVPQKLLQQPRDYKIPIEVLIMKDSSLNERFRPYSNIKTSAVFSLDDDMITKPSDVETAYLAWKDLGQRKRMLGYVSRRVGDNFEYHSHTGPYQ